MASAQISVSTEISENATARLQEVIITEHVDNDLS